MFWGFLLMDTAYCEKANQISVSVLRPTIDHQPFEPHKDANPLVNYNFDEQTPNPNQMRWKPFDIPAEPTDFVQVKTCDFFPLDSL